MKYLLIAIVLTLSGCAFAPGDYGNAVVMFGGAGGCNCRNPNVADPTVVPAK